MLAAAARLAPADARRPVATGAAGAAALTLAGTVAALPLRAASRQRAKNVGLITQSWGGWASDVAKGTAISGTLAGAGGALLVAGAATLRARTGGRRGRPRSPASPSSSPTSGRSCSTPIFNTFTPLPAGDTRDDVLELAGKAGVEVGEVYEVDASRRTTAANAYVTGIGRTKRVVLYDTLLKEFTPGRDAARRRPRARATSSTATSATACSGSRWWRRSGRWPSRAPRTS